MPPSALVNTQCGDVYVTGGHITNYEEPQRPSSPQGLIPLSRVAIDALHNSAQRYPPPKCHPGTRDAILGIIDAWMTNRLAEPILWLHGTAGVGKSAIVQTICESSLGDGGPVHAAFFFGRGQGARGRSEYLVPTIVHQLSQTNEDYRARLRGILETNRDLFGRAMPAQMHALLVPPTNEARRGWFKKLKKWLTWTRRPIVIAIDGLDECDGEENQVAIIQSLAETARASKRTLRILIASRPESHILKAFNQSSVSQQTKRAPLDDALKPADAIRLYLQDQFRAIVEESSDMLSHAKLSPSWPGEDVITILVVAASGQFIYAALVIAFVKMLHTDPLQQLEIVLDAARNHVAFSPLDSLYFHILRNVTARLQATLKNTLVCLVALAEPQTVDVIADILSVKEIEVRLVLEQLCAVLRTHSATGALFDHPIVFAHASFRDFLIDPRRSGDYSIDLTQAHNAILARISSPSPETTPPRFRTSQVMPPKTRYLTNDAHLSFHISHLSLSSAPLSIGPNPITRTTFHRNLIAFFDRIKNSALDTVYLHILRNVRYSQQATLIKAINCLAVLTQPQTADVVADLLSVDLPELTIILEDIQAILSHQGVDDGEPLLEHPITLPSSFLDFLNDPGRSQEYTINLREAHSIVLARISDGIANDAPCQPYVRKHKNISYHCRLLGLSDWLPFLRLN